MNWSLGVMNGILKNLFVVNIRFSEVILNWKGNGHKLSVDKQMVSTVKSLFGFVLSFY